MKVVAIGAVERRMRKGEAQIVTTQLTYFARMAPAATFADQASAEVRRRGVERAKEVCAIQDGAEWIQGFVDGHRHDGPACVLLHVTRLARRFPQIQEQVNYLQKRRELMDYPTRPSAGLADWIWQCRE